MSRLISILYNNEGIHIGDVHFYGFNNDSWNPATYPITRFLSETGMNSLPSLDSWRQATDNITDLQYQSHFVEHRKHDLKVNNIPYVISVLFLVFYT